MRNAMITGGLLAAILMLTVPALAADYSQFPDCGAPGDPVVIRGADFGDSPVVKFGGEVAEVVRSTDSKILCLVPEDVDEGDVSLTVDGTATDSDFTVLAAGAPVVLRMSAKTATPGQRLFLVGRRLGGGEVRFVTSEGKTAATVTPKGRRFAIAFAVPGDLAAGDYTLVVENGEGVDTGDCSPAIEIVAAGKPELDSVSPEGARPGRHVTISGTDLAPMGPCTVTWTDSAGKSLKAIGLCNGYDEIRSYVPFRAKAGATYVIVALLRGDVKTSGVVKYEVGSYGDPEIEKISPDEGPAGSLVRILGTGFLTFDAKPKVLFTNDGGSTAAKVYGAVPGIGDRPDQLLVVVPRDLADGDYDVRVVVGDATSDPVTFTVGALELSVTKMRPDGQGPKGTILPVTIVGAGFGSMRDDTKLTVVWDDGTDEYEGKVLFRSDRLLIVSPPGGRKDPLPTGTYTVTITVGDATVSAGSYTVS